MNDELRDRRRAALVDRMCATQRLLADAYGGTAPVETLADLIARRVVPDLIELHLTVAGEALGLPFIRSLAVANAKLRGVDVENRDLLASSKEFAGVAAQLAAVWLEPSTPVARVWSGFYALAANHASMLQTMGIAFGDDALKVSAAEGRVLAEVHRADILAALSHEAAD